MAPPASKASPVPCARGVGLAVFFLLLASVEGDGKLFVLGPRNSSQNLDLAMAQQLCATVGAHLASAEELRRAVRDCSFAVCTSGWLADGSIGTTVCNRTGIKPQSMKVIEVHLEMDPLPGGRYDAFCVKVEGRPCGDPPSFPHAILHDHTGFEMGDELHYVCAHGYVMSNKDMAFTLLCHTCGEWFGQVQACVKDETERHIDYEDNFPDDRSMPIEEHIKKEEEKEHKPEQISEDGNKTEPADGNNHIGEKTVYSEQGNRMIYKSEDFLIEPIIVSNDTKATKSIDSNANDSWLDGYPVTQEAVEAQEEKADKMVESMGTENITTNPPNFVGVRKTSTSSLEKDFTQTGTVPSRTRDKVKKIPVMLLPTIGLENVNISKDSDDVLSYDLTRPMELASVTTVTTLNLATWETSTMFQLVDHILLPEEDETMVSLMQTITTAASQNASTDTITDDETEALTYGLDGKHITTFEPCTGVDCSSVDKGLMIAIGITAVCLLLLATLLAAWCFKKRQQKISVYKLNGKDYTRYQLQQIEMQKI
ncbi:sushi domain-containing protein 5 [Python bivittatus]|uniref:Sushi domain-containing protein 5 n=1 Tax=Python bivittatus TaxID=176946 RepID=A0A9F2Q405_PYTBI|nr:sushi domain-containing protein 5 [Python bivittatus]